MKKLIWLPVAGFLLIAGAAVAAAAPTMLQQAAAVLASEASPAPDTTTTQTEQSEEVEADEEGKPEWAGPPAWAGHGRGGAILEEVLTDLVDNGTLSQGQADAIVDALGTKVADIRADRAALRQQMRETAQLIRTFLEDGVITQDEIDQLPAESPLREIWNSIAEDGQVTLEQLRELRPHGGPGFGRGWGHGRFHGGPPPWAGQDDVDDEVDEGEDE